MVILLTSALAQNTQTELIINFGTAKYNNVTSTLIIEKSIWFSDSHLKMCYNENTFIKMYLELMNEIIVLCDRWLSSYLGN